MCLASACALSSPAKIHTFWIHFFCSCYFDCRVNALSFAFINTPLVQQICLVFYLCPILCYVFVFVSARWHLHLQGRVSALGTTDGSWIPFEGWRSRRRGFCLRRMDEQGGSHNYCCRADHANVFLPFASVFVQCSICISAICAFVWGGWMRMGATIFVASRSRKLIWTIFKPRVAIFKYTFLRNIENHLCNSLLFCNLQR